MSRNRWRELFAPRSSPSRWVSAGIVGAALAGCYGVSYALGGAGVVAPHVFYVPVLAAAVWFGPTGALVTGLVAGVVAGPLLPLRVDAGVAQEPSDWVSRAGFFVAIGLAMALLIEGRKRAEASAARARSRYRALVENIPAAVYIEHPDEPSTAVFVSPAYERITGYSPSERVADPELWLKRLHPDDREWVLEESRLTNRTGEPFRAEYRMLAADGRTIWVRDEAVLVGDDRDGGSFWQGVLIDITARKLGEEALQQAAERLRTLHEIDRAILAASSAVEVGRSALSRLRLLVPCDRASLVLLDVTHGFARFEAVDASSQAGPAEGTEVLLAEVVEPDRIDEMELLQVPDMQADDTVTTSGLVERLGRDGFRSLIVAPLRVDGAVLGSVNVAAQASGAFDDHHVQILTEVADQVAVGISQARLRDALRAKAVELEALVADLRSAQRQRHELLFRLVQAQEDERARIATDLHDDPVQKMTAVGMRLSMLRRAVEPELEPDFVKLEETVAATIARLRTLMFELHPQALDQPGGLRRLLRDRAARLAEETGADIIFEEEVREEPSLEQRVICYRIAQEVLTNVRKHAQARRVQISVRSTRNGEIGIRIADDGVGFDPAQVGSRAGHLGLAAIRERAEFAGGSCRIDSAPGRGTAVDVRIPTPRSATRRAS